jgi:hypothetical protein
MFKNFARIDVVHVPHSLNTCVLELDRVGGLNWNPGRSNISIDTRQEFVQSLGADDQIEPPLK